MTRLNEIKKAIEKSSEADYGSSLESLRVEMNNIGYDFKDDDYGRMDAFYEARNNYWDIREEETSIDSLDPTSWNWTLRGTELEVAGKKYFIHGVIHGGGGTFTRPMVNDFIQDEAKRLHRPEKGSVVFFENGFSEEIGSFGIKDGYDFNDRSGMTKKEFDAYVSEYQRFESSLDQEKKNKMISTSRECLKNYGFTPKAKESYKRMIDFVEPMRMEFDEMKYPMITKVVGKRSKLMAQKMFQSEAKEIHAFVGLGHEDQIKYFLKKMHQKS